MACCVWAEELSSDGFCQSGDIPPRRDVTTRRGGRGRGSYMKWYSYSPIPVPESLEWFLTFHLHSRRRGRSGSSTERCHNSKPTRIVCGACTVKRCRIGRWASLARLRRGQRGALLHPSNLGDRLAAFVVRHGQCGVLVKSGSFVWSGV